MFSPRHATRLVAGADRKGDPGSSRGELRYQIKHDRDRLAGTEAEIKAMRKELENLREVIRPLAIGGMFMKRDEI